jgi:hypothetical protein
MVSKGDCVSKPEGYMQSAAEAGFYMLVLCLPYYQSLLFVGLARTICILLLACLLMFLVVRSADFCRAIAACMMAFPSSWLAPAFSSGFRELSFASLTIPNAPRISPLFQRPPPLFS